MTPSSTSRTSSPPTELAGELEGALRISSLDGLVTAFQIAPLAIGRLGVAAPDTAEAMIVECFEEAFDHESATVRRNAAIAAGYAAWPELRESLERLARTDPDPDVCSSAEAVLRAS